MPRRRLVLCSSSARKLRVLGTNLLPGRCMVGHLNPLSRDPAQADPRRISEQWVGLALWKGLQYQRRAFSRSPSHLVLTQLDPAT
jgi:hypothetical protein